MAISFTPTKVARFVGALYGVALNNSTNNAALTEIYARGFDAVANDVFASDFGSQTTAQVAQTIANNIGLTGAANTDAVAYLEGQLNGVAANARGAVISNALSLFAGLTSDATYGAAATAFEARVANAIIYSNASTSVYHGSFTDLSTGIAFNLTTGFDNLTGTSSADTFQAYSINNVSTLQDGDVLNGGAGSDTLVADIVSGTLNTGVITPRTNSIENAIFRVQHAQGDSGDNNIATKGVVDAERMVGTNLYEDNNSRADLVIEDVRIGANQITKDITVVMRDTDPGNVDFGLYFDQNSLRNVSNSTSTINLRVLDTYSVAQGTAELKDSPYGSFTFYYSANGGTTYTKVELASQAMQDAQSIDAMVVALQAQADAKFGAGVVSVSKGSAYVVPDSVTSTNVTGYEIKLTTNASLTFDTTQAGSGWKATDTVPAISGLYTSYNTSSASSTDLVTSTIILDNVGRGSNGGELIVGGLSVGATSSSKGVQQFDITVQDTSKLDGIASTNNTLRVVNIVNGTTDVQSDAYVTRVQNAGDLTVGRAALSANSDLPGQNGSAFGFTDVQTINASTMAGKLNFTAEVTTASIAKYLNLADTQGNPASDNVAFAYTGGSNNDTMAVTIDSAVAASSTLTGQPDFTFALNGGAGNDAISLSVGGNRTGAWVNDQRQLANISIDAGTGNDTVTTNAGAVIINAGTGDDTVYVDKAGTVGAKWVVNDITPAVLGDLNSNTPVHGFMYKGQLTVSFSGAGGAGLGGGVTAGAADSVAANFTNGFEVTVEIPTGTNYDVTQLHLNQAIKAAINGDATLNKLLVATDGPSNTLVISSLIDGTFNANDLRMTVSQTDVTALSTSEQATVLAAYKTFAHNSAAVIATAQAANAASVTAFNGVAGMDGNQVMGVASGSGIDIAINVVTQGVSSVSEIQTINVSALNVANGDTIDFTIDGTKVTYTNTTGNALTGDALETDIALLAGQNVAGVTYTFSNPTNGAGDLTITQQAGKGKDIANITADWSGNGAVNDGTGAEGTKGVAEVAEVFTATVTGSAAAAETITFDGVATAALTAGDNGATIAAAAVAAGATANYTVAAVGNVLTYTGLAGKGSLTDAVAGDFVSNVGTVAANGTISGNESDNTINMGAGSDVVVLGTGAFSNDTLVFTGYDQGKTTVVNFEDTDVNKLDVVDVRAYLTGKSSASGSVDSQVPIQVTLNGDATVEANSVTVLTGTFNTTTAKWSDLSAAKLLAAINSTNTGAADFAGITAATLNALNTYTGSGAATTLVGGTGHAVVLVQNNLNEGEYAMFDLTFNGLAANATADFSAAQLIGVVDFGNTVAFSATAGVNNLALFA